MSVEINNINIKEGDKLFLDYMGSVEFRVCIRVSDRGLSISGPMNEDNTSYVFDFRAETENK